MAAGIDRTELVGESDLAALREAQFVGAAIAAAAAASGARQSTPGVCSNCGEATEGAAVYCDEECRADHEARLAVQKRKGGRA